MTDDMAGPDLRRRLLAWLALAALAAAVVVLAVGAVRKWDVLLGSLVALAVLVGSVWIALSRRGVRRAVALVVAVIALVALTVVVVSGESLRILVAALVLTALAVGAARATLAGPAAVEPPGSAPPAPRHAVLLMNLRSGGGKAERFGLVDACRARGIEPIVLTPGSDLLALAEDAVARGADVLGMAGGDGSQALVATVASAHGLPFVVVPAGTRNHFALDLGLDRDDVLGALDAYTDGVDQVVDLAELNGRVFVNNASIGVYAHIVQSDAYRDAKLHTAATLLPEVVGPDATPLDLRFTLPSGAEASTAHLLLVSNNAYQVGGIRGPFTRQSLTDGLLGIVSLVVSGLPDPPPLAALQALRLGRRLPGLDTWEAAHFEVRSASPVEIGIDGEAVTMDPPLRFRIRPGALTVRLPRSAVTRAAPVVVHVSPRDTLGALWRTATARGPR